VIAKDVCRTSIHRKECGPSIIFAADGTLYTAWEADSQIKMGTRAPGASAWTIDVVDSGPAGAFHLPLRLSSDEAEIYLAYDAYDGADFVRVAWRVIP
jgi:hypothetical protein